MAKWACEQCTMEFVRDKSGSRPIRFCSPKCYQAWRKKTKATAGCFVSGTIPWNKGMKGIHLSPDSEFKKGCESKKRLPIGSVTIRSRRREKQPRAFVKVAEPNVWRERALVVWEEQKGQVPKGYVVHHKDRNSLNDSIDNLQALTRAEHINEHRNDLRNAA